MKRALCQFARILFALFLLFLGTQLFSEPWRQAMAAPPSPEKAYAVRFIAPNSELLNFEARTAIIHAVNRWKGQPPENNTFFLINLRFEDQWALATLTSANLDRPLTVGEESHLDPNNMFALVLVDNSRSWNAALETDAFAQELLSLIPDSEFNPIAKQAMFPNPATKHSSPEQQYNNYKFPWRAGEPWRMSNPAGWHDTYTGYGFPQNHSLDFDIRTASNADILAAASGTVTLVCPGAKEKLIVITTDGTSEKLGYLHLDKGSVDAEGIQQGMHIDQGRKLGRMWETPASGDSDGCGASYGTHLHIYFPEKPFTVDGKTFSQDNVHAGEDLFSSQGSNPGGGPAGYTFCANENQRCNFSGTKDVAYGANGSFNYKYNISGGIDCNNGTFGDPIPGVGKACYTKDSTPTGCAPNSDQVALFEHGGYNGSCKIFNKGEYPNPGSMGFANDTASSVKVGGNVKAILCKDDNYNGGCEEFNGDDGNLGDNNIGDNQVSSLKVQDRGGGGGCTPNSDQVALFEHGGYNGSCKIFNKGEYPNPGSMGFANDTASSVKVGGNVKAILCKDDNYNGGCEEFNGDDGNLGDNNIGDNQVSSLKVQDRGGGNGVEFCDGTNYGSPCITLTAGKYGNLNDLGWYDRIESLRFKGSYVGNYHVVLSTETNHGGTPGHFEQDEPNLQDPWRNRVRSIEINYIDRNNPPGIPTLSSPGDWYESNDGTAPNLCWNSSSDPEGDNPVQYYAEVFDSAVNANSGWITDTCWRPGQLDSQYYSYQWRVRARDNKNKESDWSATRHFTIRQPAPQKPDLKPDVPDGYPAPLVPSSIQGTHQVNTLFANARTFIDWHFINAGNGVAPGGFYVDVYIDNERIVHYGQPDFNAGWRGGFDDWAVSVMTPGLHTLKIVTDPENVVQESDENNNVWEQQFTWVNINGWRGEYFKNPTLDSNPWLTRDDANIDFDWSGGSPDPALPADDFSARWTRTTAFECGRYRFNVRVDDGVRLWVNNQQLLNEWRTQVADFHPEIDLPAGNLPIQVEYYESGGGAAIQVNWQKLSSCVTPPAAPTLNNPANSSTKPYNHDLTFQWNSVAGATEYLLEWWGGPYSTTQQCAWSSNTSCHIGTIAAGNTYSWRVKARNSAGESDWSDTWTFTIQPQPQPPAPPHDPNPANGATLSYRTTLDVSVQGDGDEFRIHVWGANYDRWRDWEASRSLHLDGLTSQTYNLQAQARNSAGTSNWSDVWTFTIQPQPQPPGAFDKTSPVNGAVNQPTNPTLSWHSSGGAASYEYCYDTLDNNACDGGWNNVGNTTSANLGGLNNGATYYWQVRAKNNNGVTDANTGAWWRFTTQSSFVNLVQNPGFELDADNNNIPDNWGANSKFTRANKPHYEGQYAGALGATDNRKVTIAQQIPNLSPGQSYSASCRVKIRKTTDTFTFKVQVRWLDSLNKAIRTDTIGKTFTGKTAGWEQVLREVVAPTGATAARFQFTATSLNAKLNLDDCAFTQK